MRSYLSYRAVLFAVSCALATIVLRSAPATSDDQLLDWLQENLSVDRAGSGAVRGLVQNERCFTGEIYTAKKDANLADPGWLFVPGESQRMLRDAFAVGLFREILKLKDDKRPGVLQRLRRVGVILTPIQFGCSSQGHAIVEFDCEIYDLEKNAFRNTTRVSRTVKLSEPGSTLGKQTLVFMIGVHRDNFVPERSGLFLAALEAAQDAVTRCVLAEISGNE